MRSAWNTKRLEGVAGRGEQRLGDLYARHAQDAIRFAYVLTGDQVAAEDIVHDAFVRLFGRFQDLRRPEAFESYLRRTIVSLSRDRFRRLRLERGHASRGASSPVHASVGSRLEDSELIRSALQALPHRQRTALVLRFFVELSEIETADVMGCSVAAVKSLVSRAMATLRNSMRGETT